MCYGLAAMLLGFVAAYLMKPTPVAHSSWKGVSVHRGGNTTLRWSLQQRHSGALTDGNTVLVHLRAACDGPAALHWRTFTSAVACPIDMTVFDVYPPQVSFASERAQRVHARIDMVKLHDHPLLTTWSAMSGHTAL